MSTCSTRSSARNAKRNSSNINNNNQEMTINGDNSTPANYSSPKDNVSVSSSTTPMNNFNKPETSNKRVKTVEENSNDILMTDTITSTNNRIQTKEITTLQTPVVVSLNESLHAPENDGNLRATVPNADHSGLFKKMTYPIREKIKSMTPIKIRLCTNNLIYPTLRGNKFLDYFALSTIFPIMTTHMRFSTNKILTYKEIIRQRHNTNQQQRPNQRNYKLQPPIYKQIHIVFKDEQPKQIWIQDNRNTQLGDLHPILMRINAQTCTFTPTNNRQLQKAAYVYVKEKDYKDQIFRIKCFNTIIYAFPQNIRLSCTICGDPTHEYTNCNNKQDPNQRSKALTIDRNHNKKPTINQQIYNQFKSIIATHNGERIIHMDQNKYIQQTKFNQSTPHIPNIPDNSTKINHLEQEINALKTQLKVLADENTSLKKELTIVKENIATNTKELLYMKEQLNHVNTKSDIMIQKLDDIALHQTNSPPHTIRNECSNQANEISMLHPNRTPNTNNNIPTERQRKIQIVSLPNHEGQNTASAPVQYPMEDINSIQGHSELGRMEREYDAEYYDQNNEDHRSKLVK
ncbi:hypothetical protein GLOIN_2v1776368 [Rhizophagus clarus]|uniref:Uncharacterized protein n=1 Tax=Rhizophagus clarus TaxID=94130 RepID=A0A8H3LNI0_9GLOM|nr:hypothetical protein GLOIN_2v1776368 [Rhizophagus clarus]